MSQKIFIAGTDTGIGKTTVACHWLRQAAQNGKMTLGIKPVASGAITTTQGLRNEDGLRLQQAASYQLDYSVINPLVFDQSIAPHLAAQANQQTLSVMGLIEACAPALQKKVDLLLIEGVGGWQVPLNDQETMQDFVVALALPVILVVGMRLGCLNHTILTYYAIKNCGLPLLGWIANCIDPNMMALADNIATLRHWIKAPFLGGIPFNYSEVDIDWPSGEDLVVC